MKVALSKKNRIQWNGQFESLLLIFKLYSNLKYYSLFNFNINLFFKLNTKKKTKNPIIFKSF